MHTRVILNPIEYKLRISKTMGGITAKDSCLDYIIYKKRKYIFIFIHAVKCMNENIRIFNFVYCATQKRHSLD